MWIVHCSKINFKCMNSTVRPIFFNKILMGLMNSARDPLNSAYCLLKSETHASKKEKEKKHQRSWWNANPNAYLIFLWQVILWILEVQNGSNSEGHLELWTLYVELSKPLSSSLFDIAFMLMLLVLWGKMYP